MTLLNQKNIYYKGLQRSFEKAIHTYDNKADIQLHASLLLIDYLAKINISPQRILDLGCGTGLITTHLCREFPDSSFYINDISQALLNKACHRLQSFHPEGLLFNFDQEWTSKNSYELIFSNMAFQWSLNIHEVFSRCYKHMKKNAILAFSLPLNESFIELSHDQHIPFHTFDYIFQGLSKVGFDILYSDQILTHKEFETQLQALKSIKQCGANYVSQKTICGMLDRSKLNQPSTLTYKIGVFIVNK